MIRKTLLLLALGFCVITVSGKTQGDGEFGFLKTSTTVNVKIDFSNADVEHYTTEQFAVFSENLFDSVMVLFIHEMNKKLARHNIIFTKDEGAGYVFLVQVTSIEEDGAVRAIVNVVDMNTISQLATFKAKAHGGMFGGFEQLFLEGMARLGENIGDHILESIE